MSDFTRINAGRADKLVAMIETITKAAASQRPPRAEVLELMAPVEDALDALYDLVPEAPKASVKFTGGVLQPQRTPVPGTFVDADFGDLELRALAIAGHDRTAIKAAYLRIAGGDLPNGMKDLRKVILGWSPDNTEE